MTKILIYIFFLFSIFVLHSCSTNINENACNFSSKYGEPERCFFGVGNRCEGIPLIARFKKDNKSCYVDGYISVGSMLHDKCCFESKNKGYFCAKPDGSMQCINEWNKAKKDSICSFFGFDRQWKSTFGPYKIGNKGDNVGEELSIPSGAKINIRDKNLCKNGCKTTGVDFCGKYCVCK